MLACTLATAAHVVELLDERLKGVVFFWVVGFAERGSIPQLRPRGTASAIWEGSMCRYFFPLVGYYGLNTTSI